MTVARGAVLAAPGAPFEVRRFRVPPPGPGMALVRTSCCTICGSDIHAWTGRRPPAFLPAILGHEVVGTVEALGEGGLGTFSGAPLCPGDRVTFGLAAGCGRCFYCTEARLPQKCRSLFKYGHTTCDDDLGLTGGLAEAMVLVPGTAVFRVPEEVSDAVGATAMCAGATMMHALEDVSTARSVALVGMGMLGLWGLRIALARGAETVICLDVDERRLAFAREAGATGALNVEGKTSDAVAGFVREFTGGEGAGVGVDLSGRPEGIALGIKALRTGGVLSLVGSVVPSDPVLLDPFETVTRALTVRGVHNYRPEHLEQALELVRDPEHHGAIERGVSRRFSLESVDAAFRAAHRREALRVAVVFDGESEVASSGNLL